MMTKNKHVEFRIPISPSEGFYAQVRFFNFALRRLGPPYDRARLRIIVGDFCNIDAVRRENIWSEDFNVVWERVPDEIFSEFGIWGTANWRLKLPAGDAEIICLSDADTVMLREIDPLLNGIPDREAAICGHMAHMPPPSSGSEVPSGNSPEFWPWLFRHFNIDWPPENTYCYSMDANGDWPRAPAYFNLGFIAMNAPALAICDAQIIEIERRIKHLTQSHMRCQIALTVIAHRAKMNIGVLSAAYNAANDLVHLSTSKLDPSDIRIIHYLRGDEINRSTIFTSDNLDDFLKRPLHNPVNQLLQRLGSEYRSTIT